MKKKIMVFILGLIGMCILTGCRFSSNKEFKSGQESVFEEFDVDYTSNEDGTYTYKENIYKYKIDVTGIEGENLNIFRILTNNKETSYEEISYSLKKSEVSTEIPKFVILGWKSDNEN
jgi:uncharacterized protein YxeA